MEGFCLQQGQGWRPQWHHSNAFKFSSTNRHWDYTLATVVSIVHCSLQSALCILQSASSNASWYTLKYRVIQFAVYYTVLLAQELTLMLCITASTVSGLFYWDVKSNSINVLKNWKNCPHVCFRKIGMIRHGQLQSFAATLRLNANISFYIHLSHR